MSWFTNRVTAGQSKPRVVPWRFGRAARETAGDTGLGRRRAHRVNLNAPVFLYGSMNGEPFSEYSETIDVSTNGALVGINARLVPEQRILLTNLQTEQDLQCRIVRIDNHKIVAALEFLESCPRFWCIEFAPLCIRG